LGLLLDTLYFGELIDDKLSRGRHFLDTTGDFAQLRLRQPLIAVKETTGIVSQLFIELLRDTLIINQASNAIQV